MKRLLALVLALAALPAGAAEPPKLIDPGYWEATTNWLGLVRRTERYCITPQNVSKFLLGPCNHHYKCDYPVQEVGDGKAHFEGDIRGSGELYHVTGSATYTATTLTLHMNGSGHWKLVPIPAAFASIQAHMLSPDCPAGAKRL